MKDQNMSEIVEWKTEKLVFLQKGNKLSPDSVLNRPLGCRGLFELLVARLKLKKSEEKISFDSRGVGKQYTLSEE